ncbi:hypothetical protein KY330_05820 [Candidatus Woesearchaeota archaeon]|nr:hypothetical protein [Candidatus Woesearchaeota archaeon]
MNLALNPFDKGRKPEKEDKVKLDNRIEELFQKLDVWALDMALTYSEYAWRYPNIVAKMLHKFHEEKPFEKNDFNLLLNLFWAKDYHKFSELGHVYSRLYNSIIKYAYNQGFNDFRFKPPFALTFFADNLRASPENRLRITIDADVNIYFGRNSYFCDFVVNGDAIGGGFGKYASHSSFKAKDVHFEFGGYAQDCVFEFDTLVSDEMPLDFMHCVSEVPHNSIIKCHDKELRPYLNNVKDRGGNKVIYL